VPGRYLYESCDSKVSTAKPILSQPNPSGAPQLAKKPNYDFEKRKKELDRKAKRDEKIRNKRSDAARAREETDAAAPIDDGAAPAPE
jgi:hypothetical protein